MIVNILSLENTRQQLPMVFMFRDLRWVHIHLLKKKHLRVINWIQHLFHLRSEQVMKRER